MLFVKWWWKKKQQLHYENSHYELWLYIYGGISFMLVAPIQNVLICNENTVVCNCVCVYFYNKQKKSLRSATGVKLTYTHPKKQN